MVLTHRPEFQSRWSGAGPCRRIEPVQADPGAECGDGLALAGGKALPEALLEQILTRTDGVPLFVEELTKSILEMGELKEAGDHYEYGGSARAVTIPATLRDLLMARLDRFMPVKEIAQIGAAIGREFSYELDRRGRADAAGATRRCPHAAERVGTGLPTRHAARCHLHFQACAGAGRGL